MNRSLKSYLVLAPLTLMLFIFAALNGDSIYFSGAYLALGTLMIWATTRASIQELFPILMLFIFWLGLGKASTHIVVFPYLWAIEFLVLLRTGLFLLRHNRKSILLWIPVLWGIGSAGFLLLSNLTGKVDPAMIWVQPLHLKVFLFLSVLSTVLSFFFEI